MGTESAIVRVLLPDSAGLPCGAARALQGGYCLLLAIIAVTAVHALGGVGGAGLESVVRHGLIVAGLALVAGSAVLRARFAQERRRPLILTAAAVCSYAVAFALWAFWLARRAHPPVPSPADPLWVAFYPLIYASLLDRSGGVPDGLPAGIWLDGVLAGSAIAALGAAFVLPALMSSAHGVAGALAMDLVYPVGDGLLLALLLAIIAVHGWRVSRSGALFISAVVVLLAADCLWGLQIGHGATTGDSADLLLFLIAFALLGSALWQPARPAGAARFERWSTIALPITLPLSSVAVLVADHFTRVPLSALGLAVLTLVAGTLRMMFTFRDMRALASARQQALTDELTGLPNRRMFMQRLGEATAAAQAGAGAVSALILDLDNFKELNDTLGHQAGDEVLRALGRRLKATVPAGDAVARLGGDEFAAVIPAPAQAGRVSAAARAMLAALGEPFRVQGLLLRVGGSVGVASLPEHAESPEELMRCADIAMYLAKESRRGWEIYASERDRNSRERLVLASDLAVALERGGVEAHFQPIVDTRTREVVGAEALVRWRRPDGTLIPPDEFVAAAEFAGLSRHLTRRVLDLALEQLAVWRQAGFDLHVAVNTTAADLRDLDFPADVTAALARRQLPPEALVLEVTESSILSDPVRIDAVLEQLRVLGVGIALDDFGTGYSSLTHLRTLPVIAVKIDRSFVGRMLAEPADAAIVHATTELAHTLGLAVVAEGVEDELTLMALAGIGCDRIQGYVFGRPQSPADFLARLRGQPAAAPPRRVSRAA